MGHLFSARLWFCFCLLVAAAVHGKTERVYTDTQKRFSLELPQGWTLYPVPGDTTGMSFRRAVDGTFALLRVSVRPMRTGETLASAMDDATTLLRGELGYHASPDTPASLGLLSAQRRSITAYASGNPNVVRAIEVIGTIAFGHVHIVQFEHLDKERTRFARDLDRLAGTYRPLVGRGVYAQLVSTWKSIDGGNDLLLLEDNVFQLGKLRGTYEANESRLTLQISDGQEHYRYQISGRRLTLSSSNLATPMQYERSGSVRFSDDARAQTRSRKTTKREHLIGRWIVVDSASTEPLVLQLSSSGAVSFGPLTGRWRYKRGLLTIDSAGGTSMTYAASLDGERLLLGGGDLENELRLVRQ